MKMNGSFNDRGFWDLRPFVPRLSESQSSLEQLLQMNPHEKPPVRVKVRLSLKAVHKNGERWFDRRVTKILQSGPASRFGAKRVAFQQP
jgi:hypothetical protein